MQYSVKENDFIFPDKQSVPDNEPNINCDYLDFLIETDESKILSLQDVKDFNFSEVQEAVQELTTNLISDDITI